MSTTDAAARLMKRVPIEATRRPTTTQYAHRPWKYPESSTLEEDIRDFLGDSRVDVRSLLETLPND